MALRDRREYYSMNDGHVQMASHDGLIIIPERRIPSNQTHFTCHQFRPAYFGPNRNSLRVEVQRSQWRMLNLLLLKRPKVSSGSFPLGNLQDAESGFAPLSRLPSSFVSILRFHIHVS
jgi:hypothetical protein